MADYPFAKHKQVKISAKTLSQLGSNEKLSLRGERYTRLLHGVTEADQKRMCCLSRSSVPPFCNLNYIRSSAALGQTNSIKE